MSHREFATTTAMSPAVRSIGALCEEAVSTIEVRFARGATSPRVLGFGLVDVDDLVAPLRPGTVCVVGSRSAGGRTTFALGAALFNARHGRPVLFASNEVTSLDVALRAIAIDAGVWGSRLRDGRLTATEWARISRSVGWMASWPLSIADRVSSIEHLTNAVAGFDEGSPPPQLLVVDAVEAMVRSGLHIRPTLAALRALAQQSGAAMVFTSRLAATRARESEAVDLGDLGFHGSLEDFADVILLLDHAPGDGSHRQRSRVARVVKNRFGPTGQVDLVFSVEVPIFLNTAPALLVCGDADVDC